VKEDKVMRTGMNRTALGVQKYKTGLQRSEKQGKAGG
jgi:hypothetical protein